MSRTMKDLRKTVRQKLYETLDGREIDMMKGVAPRLPHMLGVTPINSIHEPESEQGTLFDPSHEFWNEYEEPISTKGQATEKLETAVRSLKEDNIFKMLYPYGREAEIIYCEIEPEEDDKAKEVLQSSCPECGTTLQTSPSLELNSGLAYIKVSASCTNCAFSGTYQTVMHRQ